MKACWDIRLAWDLAATPPVCRTTRTSCTRRCACAWAAGKWWDFSAIIICPTWWVSCIAGWIRSPPPRISISRIRAIGESVPIGRPLTVSLILDGENAWEYFPGNGREFLRQFYRRIDNDPDILALTASEAAAAAAGEIPRNNGIFPASWISANFDVWIGSGEDVVAWDHLTRARDFYQQQADNAAKGFPKAPTAKQLAASYEALLAAEGSDWCWWYGPEHSSANDAEFDAFYRKLLTEVYRVAGRRGT